jgi:hypothetical protein
MVTTKETAVAMSRIARAPDARIAHAKSVSCFWRWPWGHRWELVKPGFAFDELRCVVCCKRKRRWSDCI